MFTTYQNFWASYRSVANYYETFNRILNWVAPIDIRKGWDIYNQAKNQSTKVLVMGRTCVDEAGRQPHHFGNAITEEDHVGLGVITHGAEAVAARTQAGFGQIPVTTGGMVMHYYNNIGASPSGAWRGINAQGNRRSGYHFFYNDAWLLGGAHGLCDFNLASPRWFKNIWDSQGQRLTATGREAVFLDSCGYRLEKVGALEVLTSKNDSAATSSSFQSLVGAVSAVRRKDQINKLCVPGSPT
ncbi:hypothetical protein [Teredinibacter turnerae]|uniref:hypothetical protein n=1 Tax=Teredinibacter turnerae TaxID=2426 RepID=UPI0003703290|nr:hypothetical protein [Teredinibacter turnerae]